MVSVPENKVEKENIPNFEDDPFRLRSFVGLLAKAGHLDIIDHAVALADIAQTGAHLPLMSDLDEELIDPIKEASLELFEFNLD